MRIGVITYYRVANFGANLQAVSTYRFLEKAGHTPIFIHYMSKQLYAATDERYEFVPQIKAHLDFIDNTILHQTETCFTAEDINNVIRKHHIEAIIVGSDAVLQHHPLRSRIYIHGRRLKRIRIEHVNDERLFPNLFWGCGIIPDIKKALMSVSSQNSEYKYFSEKLKSRMNEALKNYLYISVRDTWTQEMVRSITGKTVPLTPDPVFAFNHNATNLIPCKEDILKKYNLPEKYILVSFLNVPIPDRVMPELKKRFKDTAELVALPSPIGVCFNHNFEYEIPLPLNPIDWYALIKYSCGYIGNNMHPIVVALHNGIPCFSIDNYSSHDFFGRPKNNRASKIEDLMHQFLLENNYIVPFKNNTLGLDEIIYRQITTFPSNEVINKSNELYERYQAMMVNILNVICP